MYEVVPHTADLGLRIEADSLKQLFAEAGRGLFTVIVANLDDVACSEQISLQIAGDEHDFLLFDWLSELLYTFETQHLLLAEFDVEFTDDGVSAQCCGEKVDPARHQMDHEVKAITYHGLNVQQQGQRWLAEVIVDI